MDIDLIKKFLEENHITLDGKKWKFGEVELPYTTIVQMPMCNNLPSGITKADLTAYMKEQKELTAAKKKSIITNVSEIGQVTIGIFLDELAKDPDNKTDPRKYLDNNVPQMRVDPTLLQLPYDPIVPGNRLNESDLISIYQSFMDLNADVFGKVKKPETLFMNYFKRQRHVIERAIVESIKYDPNKIREADYFLAELYNLYKPAFVVFNEEYRFSFSFFKAVIRHFIWNVKTKAVFGTNKSPFMLNLSGGQGNGKSSFVEHLAKDVLKNMYSMQDISVLQDQFGSRLLAEQWVIFFDEMVNHGQIDADKLKQVITRPEVKSRVMFSQNTETVTIRSVFIGAANKPIYEIVHDTTGMRRYLNLQFTNEAITSNKELHKVLDAYWEKFGLSLWQSVDETRPDGYFVDNLDAMWKEAQKSYVSENNSVILWLKAENLTIHPKQNLLSPKTLEESFNSYKEYWNKQKSPITFQFPAFKKFIKERYNGMHNTKYTPGELTIVHVGYLEGSTQLFDDAESISVIPPTLDRFKEFKLIDLGPGQHLYQIQPDLEKTRIQADSANDAYFAKNANAVEDILASMPKTSEQGGQNANDANATANGDATPNAQNLAKNAENPVNKEVIGNIGNLCGSYNNEVTVGAGIQVLEGLKRQQRQPGDPNTNTFEIESDAEPVAINSTDWDVREPSQAEIDWYLAEYGQMDATEEGLVEIDDEAAEKALAYLKEWQQQLRQKRAERAAQKAQTVHAEPDVFKTIEQTIAEASARHTLVEDVPAVQHSTNVTHEDPAEYAAEPKQSALVDAGLAEAKTQPENTVDDDEEDFFRRIREEHGMK